jgi:membrane protein YdbS with pleckstrin-like domain
MNELSKIIGAEEKVLWEGGPVFSPFFLSRTAPLFIVALTWTGALTLFGPWSVISKTPHFWIGLALLVFPPIYNYLVFYKTHYAITDKRIIFQAGVVGRDFKMIDFDQITNAEVQVGLFDKLFGAGNTGTIKIATAGTVQYGRHGKAYQVPYELTSITSPYEVFKFVKQVSHDVKTDIGYPNQLRPAENPGYKTNYEPPTKP